MASYSGLLDALAQGGKSWKTKYFILKDNFLIYYKDLESKKPEGIIPLESSQIILSSTIENCFEISTNTRRYHLRTLNNIDTWISKCIDASNLTIDILYDLKEILGQGTFSKVKRGIDRLTNISYAVKIIDKTDMLENKESILTEIAILKQVDHPHILKLHQIFESKKKIYLVTELLLGGELFDRIVAYGSYSEVEASKLMKNIVEALQYLHSKGIVHRDLKPENLLFNTKETYALIKITDFGLSKFTDINNPNSELNNSKLYQTACGTPGYVAPEVLEQRGYDKSVDMWSVGVILYILLCGFPPFYADSDAELYEQIKSCEFSFPSPYWDNISESVKELIRSLLQREPTLRPNPEQVLSNPWMQGIFEYSDVLNLSQISQLPALKYKNTLFKIKSLKSSSSPPLNTSLPESSRRLSSLTPDIGYNSMEI